jgi:hypothetical protein
MITGFLILAEPESLQYPYAESISSLTHLCDRIIINYAAGKTPDVRQLEEYSLQKLFKLRDESTSCKIDIVLDEMWPVQEKIQYEDLRLRFQNGLNMCDSGWFLRFDADNIFYRSSTANIKKKLESHATNAHIVYFPRIDVVNKETFHVNRGSRDLYALNVDLLNQDKISYRISENKRNWCGASFDKEVKEEIIKEDSMMPVNYDATFFTRSRLIDFWKKTFILYQNAGMTNNIVENMTEDQIIKHYKDYIFGKRRNTYKNTSHPEDVQHRVDNLTPQHWGYDNFGGPK